MCNIVYINQEKNNGNILFFALHSSEAYSGIYRSLRRPRCHKGHKYTYLIIIKIMAENILTFYKSVPWLKVFNANKPLGEIERHNV